MNRLMENEETLHSKRINALKCDVSIMISAGRLTLKHLLKSAGARHTSYSLSPLLNSSQIAAPVQ